MIGISWEEWGLQQYAPTLHRWRLLGLLAPWGIPFLAYVISRRRFPAFAVGLKSALPLALAYYFWFCVYFFLMVLRT